VTKKMQYIILWFGFFCAISAPAATKFKPAQDYLVVFSGVHLYEKIPSDEKILHYLLGKEKELPKIEKSDHTLKQGDQVQEFSKEDGKYTEIACQKSSNGAQYDWSLMRDWLCVKVISPDASNVGETGWLHRSGAISKDAPDGVKLTLYIQHLPPFTKCESGKPEGVGVEIVKQTCGAACEVVCKDNWKEVIDTLSRRKNSGLFFISLIGDNRTAAYSAIPVLKTSYALFTLEKNKEKYPNESKSALKDALKNGRMEAYGPSGTYSHFELFARGLDPLWERTPFYHTTADIINALETGEIDVVYSNSNVMRYYKELKTQIIQTDQKGVPYYIGISKETHEEIIGWLKGVIKANKAAIDQLLQQADLTTLSQ